MKMVLLFYQILQSLLKIVFDYMKECAEFQLELGGKQCLVCWGGGLYELGTSPEQSWLYMLDNVGRFAEWCLDKKLRQRLYCAI